MVRRGRRRRRRRRYYQRGGILPFLIPLGILEAKAAATGAISGGVGYGVTKALEKRRKKKIVRPANMTLEEERATRRALGI